MTEREFIDADYEVIRMVNEGHRNRLPSVSLTFIPSDRAERVEALGRRLEAIRKAMPVIVSAAVMLFGLLAWRAF